MTPNPSLIPTTKSNAGYKTEDDHYTILTDTFGIKSVSSPKGASGGSDFIVLHDDKVIKFESKTNTTDQFDAGVLSLAANGFIYNASSFITEKQLDQIEFVIKKNVDQVENYASMANTNLIPHYMEKLKFEEIKANGGLINIRTVAPLHNIIEDSFVQGKNRFVKANYIVVSNDIFCISHKPELDPLGLRDYGAAVLDDDCINYFTIRSGRTGAKNGMISSNIRVLYKLKKTLPATKVKLL